MDDGEMTLLEKEFYTEREAIELLMLYSYSDGSEFETTMWKSGGSLKGGHDSHKAVIRKLNCLFDDVRIEGKGSKRKYFLNGLKDQPLKDTGGNIGRRITSEGYLMDEYVFNQLLNTTNLGMPRTHKTWVRDLELTHRIGYGAKPMYTMLYELHKDTRDSFQTSKIRNEFINAIEARNIDVVEGAFERLEKAGRIKVDLECNVKRLNGNYETVTPEEYQQISDSFNEFLSFYDTTLFRYTNLKKKLEPSTVEQELLTEAREFLGLDNIDFFFKSYYVKIINTTVHQAVTREEYDTAYFDRFITLTRHRQNDYTKKDSDFFWQKYYKLNTFAILKQMGIKGLDEEIEEELNKRPVMAFVTTNNLDLTEIF